MASPATKLGLLLCLCIVASSVGKKNLKGCHKPCTVKSKPVCGNDGRNYTTRCQLSVARCEARKFGQIIIVQSNGTCTASKPLSPCGWSCSERRQKISICASNGQTYKNLCQFKKAKCEARKKKTKPITRISCAKLKTKSTCRKFSSCPKIFRPVCGSNNKTYRHICYLKTVNCIRKRQSDVKKYVKLSLKHCGACGRARLCSLQSSPEKCLSVKICDLMLRPMPVYVGKKVNPKRKNVKKNKKLKKGKGQTKRGFPLAGKKLTKKITQRKLTKGKKAKKIAYSKLRKFMVCGSDGRTYSSVCHLQVEQCNKRKKCQRLSMRYKGPCKK